MTDDKPTIGRIAFGAPSDPTKWPTDIRSEKIEVPMAEELVKELNRLRRENESLLSRLEESEKARREFSNSWDDMEGRLNQLQNQLDAQVLAAVAALNQRDETRKSRDGLVDENARLMKRISESESRLDRCHELLESVIALDCEDFQLPHSLVAGIAVELTYPGAGVVETPSPKTCGISVHSHAGIFKCELPWKHSGGHRDGDATWGDEYPSLSKV